MELLSFLIGVVLVWTFARDKGWHDGYGQGIDDAHRITKEHLKEIREAAWEVSDQNEELREQLKKAYDKIDTDEDWWKKGDKPPWMK